MEGNKDTDCPSVGILFMTRMQYLQFLMQVYGLWGLWRLLKGKLTRRKICGLLYFLLAPLGKQVCHEALAIRLQTKIHPQNPHLSVCVWCPMLLAGVSSTAHGDLCG